MLKKALKFLVFVLKCLAIIVLASICDTLEGIIIIIIIVGGFFIAKLIRRKEITRQMRTILLWLGKIYTEGNTKGTNRAVMKVELIFLCGVTVAVSIYRLSVDRPSDNFTGFVGGATFCCLTILFWIGEAKFQKIIKGETLGAG